MSSLLEQARARAAARRERQITVTLPELGIDLVCDVPTNAIENDRLATAAKKTGKTSWPIHYARALIAAQTREVRIDGQIVEVDGEPVTFRDPELWAELNVADAKGAVVALLGTDGDIMQIATELIDEAGFTSGRDGDDDPM